MTDETHKQSSWWGSFKLEIEQNKEWHLGPLKLIVRRLKSEWQVAHETADDFENLNTPLNSPLNSPLNTPLNSPWEINNTEQLPETLDNNSRYILHDTTGQLIITPQLADRPIISRPHMPFNLAAGEEITLYVSSSLWLELAIGSTPSKVLKSIAIQRLSDTWFGPSTLEGELCYASTTHCRLNLEDLPKRSYKAITPVLIRNQSKTTLLIERLNLPTPLLSLYASSNGQLWTPQVTLTREKDGDMAELKIDNHPPEDVGIMEKISDAHNEADSSVLFRAFNTVFS